MELVHFHKSIGILPNDSNTNIGVAESLKRVQMCVDGLVVYSPSVCKPLVSNAGAA